MANAQSIPPESISLDDVVALADEMAALARIGVPLERGLASVARDLTGGPSKLATHLAERMQAGETLLHIFSTSPGLFPPAYRAVVEAGARSGRLASALEGLASSARRAADLRRMTRAAMVYPMVVALLAYGFFIVSITRYQPGVSAAYESLHVPADEVNRTLSNWGRSATSWGPVAPLLALVPLGLWWYRSGCATYRGAGLMSISPARRLIMYGRIATFADVLALLIEHDAPLGESMVLAADASGDRGLKQAARDMAGRLEQGGGATTPDARAAKFPPFLSWLLSGRGNGSNLAEALRHTAQAYRRRADRLDDRLRLYLPVAMTLGIGGTAVVLYALSVFVPWYKMLEVPTL